MKREKKFYAFTWKVQNASYCFQKKGQMLQSPMFAVNSMADVLSVDHREGIDETQWQLCFYPRGHLDDKHISLYLLRDPDCKGPPDVEIKYELALLAKDGAVLKDLLVKRRRFTPGASFGFSKFLPIRDVFSAKRSAFLPKDILTIRCKMWIRTEHMVDERLYFARTIIGVEKVSFFLNIPDFSALESNKKFTRGIKSLETDEQVMSLHLFVSGGLNFKEVVRFELTIHDQAIKFFTMQLFLVEAFGEKMLFHQDEHWFDDVVTRQLLTTSLTKENLLSKKSLYLPNDVLSWYFECYFSKGIAFNYIERVDFPHHGSQHTFSVAEKEKKRKIRNEVIPMNVYENLQSLLKEHALCDIKLKTNSSTFPAHKVVFGACSSVFKEMFTSDRAEENSDCLNIEESDDVVIHMLQYAYTGRVQDATWDLIAQLYEAAEKYAILGLKSKCSSILKNKLTPSNVCKLLVLADLHADVDLKPSVQDFILQHALTSPEWNCLMENDPRLASETLFKGYISRLENHRRFAF